MDLHIDLANTSGRSLRSRVEHALREAVRDGRLAPGSRLPSTRALCAQLGVSRGVVVDAYAQLAAEGYLQTRRGGGTNVARAISRERASTTKSKAQVPVKHDMSPFRPALDRFPRTAWARALTRALRTVSDERLGYPDPAGVPELRSTLSAYLGRVRGVRAKPDRLVITNGTRHGVALLWAALADLGAKGIAIEQPGWAGMRETAADAGLELFCLEVDDEGVSVERLMEARVDAVALSPAHQYPTGAVLSAARRTQLVAWCKEHDVLIVEDDYDAEYRYDRNPIGSLQGLAPEQVAYVGSTSKTLAPAVRVGWMALPERLAQPVAEIHRTRGGGPSPLLQLALADLIERGDLDRHLRRQRRAYKRQRDALLTGIANALPEVKVRGAAAGLYVVLDLPEHLDEKAVVAATRARGIVLEGLGSCSPALVVGYANLSQAAIEPAVTALAASINASAASAV